MSAVKKIFRTWQDHFFESVIVSDGCWGWTIAHNPDGYAMWQPSGKFAEAFGTGMRQMAYRVLWEILRGPIPEGMELDHLCRMKGCINPDHLEPVTHAENLRRCRSRLFCGMGHRLSETREVVLYAGGKKSSRCGVCYAAFLKRHRDERHARGLRKPGRRKKVSSDQDITRGR